MSRFRTALRRAKAAIGQGLTAVGRLLPTWNWVGGVLEAAGGNWQRGIVTDSKDRLLQSSPIYACIALIAGDISKLRPKLMFELDGIPQEAFSAAFSPVLKKPNRYQTRIQFLNEWMTSKLIHGNTYVLKERDNRNVVVALYVLNPLLVTVLVADDGGVYYQLSVDKLSGVQEQITIPASEIIHDRGICPFHPLVGVGPIYAAAMSATQSNRIQTNASVFFENMSRPSGQLTAPGTIDDETAARLKKEFEQNFSGSKIGRLFVAGDGLQYEAMTIPAQQSQLTEQLRWTGEDVARCFGVPGYKVGLGPFPTQTNIAALDVEYYKQCLQKDIEGIEILLEEGLALPAGFSVELDLDGLLRMDPLTQAQVNTEYTKSGVMKPNEARAAIGKPPVEGGDTPYLQQQNFPLSALVNQVPPGSKRAPVMGDERYQLRAIEMRLDELCESLPAHRRDRHQYYIALGRMGPKPEASHG
jgi:HK97 family phage portal protein